MSIKYGYWTVLVKSSRPRYILCECVCGRRKEIFDTALRRGKSKSCGCMKQQLLGNTGASSTRTYSVYHNMKKRCLNKNTPNYRIYGGRGITICKRWLISFKNFLADMGDCPSKEHTIERIDNNGNYEPTNCKWATRLEQSKNTRRSVKLTFRGETKVAKDWATQLGISEGALKRRLERGWTLEEALTTKHKIAEDRYHRYAKTITYLGRTQTIKKWAKEIGISKGLLKFRLANWSLKEALTTPKGKYIKKNR